ncbi:hypothetical protein AcV7_003532 [Taiwanofungus camphoratus]|nr:hypothetical protein AcV7_003532 [Antrodia cinnamomea]
MAQPPHGSWPPKGHMNQGQRQFSNAPQTMTGSYRRAGSGEPQSFAYLDSYTHEQNESYQRITDRGNVRPSSPTSSLSGAMGDTHISSHPQLTIPSGMAWTPQGMSQGGYSANAVEGGSMTPYGPTPPTPITSASPSGAFSVYQYPQYNSQNFSNPSLETMSPIASPAYPESFSYQQSRAQAMMRAETGLPNPLAAPPGTSEIPTYLSQPPTPPMPMSMSRSSLPLQPNSEDVIRRLQQRISELEVELARTQSPGSGAPSVSGSSTLPSPLTTPTLPQAFQEDWRARTEARKKIYCSLNRAGNALCAWHDSRRERRAFPPRMAPPGYLNCGCTYEEALFEESLSRHGVGSYHPGETVRMDPALRNPLLKLLQERYDYRDGDFERDPITGSWVQGESAAKWENKLASGTTNTRRNRGEERR